MIDIVLILDQALYKCILRHSGVSLLSKHGNTLSLFVELDSVDLIVVSTRTRILEGYIIC